MKITVNQKYIVFPANRLASKKKFVFSEDGEEVYTLNIKYDAQNPDFTAYIDLSRFLGKTLDLTVEPSLLLFYSWSDEMDIEDLYREPMRPQIHFSCKNGWLNDPNGLIYFKGKYHLFFQHNPALNEWDNMHWGHAVSEDLLHWEEVGDALFPNKDGAVYSGSAICPEQVKEGPLAGLDGIGLIHTRTNPYSQWLAVSNPEATAFHIFGDKPILSHRESENRDPKVVYCDELACFVMVIYLEDDRYLFLHSEDLMNWDVLQEEHLPGDNECPDLFALFNEEGKKKWILAGAADHYRIGEVKDGKFFFSAETKRFGFSRGGYAGQSISGLPDGQVIRIPWDRFYFPSVNRFHGQMGIPMKLSLHKGEEGEEIWVAPIDGIESLVSYSDTQPFTLTAGNTEIYELADTPVRITLTGNPYSSGCVEAVLFGRPLKIDFAAGTLTMSDAVLPLCGNGKDLSLSFLIDRCSFECFNGGNGYFALCDDGWLPDRNLPTLVLKSDADFEFVLKTDKLKSTLPRM